MSQFISRPFLSAGLVLLWLMLTGFTLGQLILGMGVAWIAVLAAERVDLPRSRIRRIRPALRMAWRVTVDIARSNLAVARIVLAGPRFAAESSGFLDIDIALRDEAGLAILGIVTTAIPGTVWVDYDRESGHLVLHVLDLRHPERVRADVQTYARLLKEIFE